MKECNFPYSQLNASQRALMAARLVNQGDSSCVGAAALLGISDDAPYRISFNGERVAPWMRTKR